MWLPFADALITRRRAAVRLAVNVNGTTLQVFATHLQSDNPTARYESMPLLKSWAAGYSTPQLAAGDFNADVDQIDTIACMLPSFIDSWSIVGAGPGYTADTPAPTKKLDYWFADASVEKATAELVAGRDRDGHGVGSLSIADVLRCSAVAHSERRAGGVPARSIRLRRSDSVGPIPSARFLGVNLLRPAPRH